MVPNRDDTMSPMGKSYAAPQSTPHSISGEDGSTPSDSNIRGQRGAFVLMTITMSWQLAIAVIVPIIVGVQLDKMFKHSSVFTLVGLAFAFVGSAVVMWRTMKVANRLPVPKLSAAEKRAIKKQYEEDDADA